MASRRRQRRNACSGKIRYATLADAMIARAQIIRRWHDRMNAYRCDYCGGGFHLGHSRKGG